MHPGLQKVLVKTGVVDLVELLATRELLGNRALGGVISGIGVERLLEVARG